MPAGEAFSSRQREDIDRAIKLAKRDTGLDVSVYVGTLEAPERQRAETLHGALSNAAVTALVAVDPSARRLEIVTGSQLRTWLDDRACSLAALAMTTSFAAGDLSGGIVDGIRSLTEHARRPEMLHLDTP